MPWVDLIFRMCTIPFTEVCCVASQYISGFWHADPVIISRSVLGWYIGRGLLVIWEWQQLSQPSWGHKCVGGEWSPVAAWCVGAGIGQQEVMSSQQASLYQLSYFCSGQWSPDLKPWRKTDFCMLRDFCPPCSPDYSFHCVLLLWWVLLLEEKHREEADLSLTGSGVWTPGPI